jgi:hypothetical protein
MLMSGITAEPYMWSAVKWLSNGFETADDDKNTAPVALGALQCVVAAKQQLLQQQDDDAEWDTVAWTTLDSQALLRAVADAAGALSSAPNHSDVALDVTKAVVQAAAGAAHASEADSACDSSTGSWLQQLASVVLTVKGSWEVLPEEQKQADHAPLELVCSTGLLLVRLSASATACRASSSGTCQQLALQLLRALCSSTVQQLLQESLAGHLFIFRWHEQPTAAADLDAVMLRKPLLTPPSSNNTNSAAAINQPISSADDSCSTSPASAAQLQLPRLVPADCVPAAHRAWCGSFLLPLLPSAGHWAGGQEVLLGWSAACSRAEQLGLPLDIKPGDCCGCCCADNSWLLNGYGWHAEPATARMLSRGSCRRVR